MKTTLIRFGLVLAFLAAALVVLKVLDPPLPRLTDDQVRSAITTTLDLEAPEAFLVTGRLEMTATTRVENSKVLLPGIIGLNLGTSWATVRVPGTVSYGFEADSIRPDMIRVLEDGSVEIELPPLAVYSVEPHLARMEVQTDRGWARAGDSEDAVERRAIAILEGAFRRQALSHLRNSYQPRINTARALEVLLMPVLQGLGMEDPVLRFRVGDGVLVERSGG